MHTDFHFNFSQCFISSKNRAEIQTQIFLSHSTTQTKIGQLSFMNWGSEGRSGCDSLGKSWDLNPDHRSPAPLGTSFVNLDMSLNLSGFQMRKLIKGSSHDLIQVSHIRGLN